jgi:hypothetical protein
MEDIKRPLGVTIVSLLLIIGTIFFSLLVISLLPILTNISANLVFDNPTTFIPLFFNIFLIPVSIILAIGLLKGVNFARFSTLILYSIAIIFAFYSHNLISYFGVICSLIVILYLTRPHVKDYFYGIKSPTF